jgi:hypothetical protein
MRQGGEIAKTVLICSGGVNMATVKNPGSRNQGNDIPVMQRVLDNPFLLLFLGVVFPTVFYILWGIMEVVSIPLAK